MYKKILLCGLISNVNYTFMNSILTFKVFFVHRHSINLNQTTFCEENETEKLSTIIQTVIQYV